LLARSHSTKALTRVSFSTSAGSELHAELTHCDSARAAVLLRSPWAASDLLGAAAQRLRTRQWGSLVLESCDPIGWRTTHRIEHNLRAAIEFMRSLGYRVLAVWGHGFEGDEWTSEASSFASMVLSDAIGPPQPGAPSCPTLRIMRATVAGDVARAGPNEQALEMGVSWIVRHDGCHAQ
jgi:hypothetical protein